MKIKGKEVNVKFGVDAVEMYPSEICFEARLSDILLYAVDYETSLPKFCELISYDVGMGSFKFKTNDKALIQEIYKHIERKLTKKNEGILKAIIRGGVKR